MSNAKHISPTAVESTFAMTSYNYSVLVLANKATSLFFGLQIRNGKHIGPQDCKSSGTGCLRFLASRSPVLCSQIIIQKKQGLNPAFLRTEGRDRTGTSVTSSVFETDASTDSATSAYVNDRDCKINTFFDTYTSSAQKKFDLCFFLIKIDAF